MTENKGLPYLFAVVLIIFVLPLMMPSSEARIVRDWPAAENIDEAILPIAGLQSARDLYGLGVNTITGTNVLGPIRNRYYCEGLGEVSEVRIRSVSIRSWADLPGISGLSQLRKLDLMGNPLAGEIDVSKFPHLEELALSRASNPRIVGLVGASSLRRLTVRSSGVKDIKHLLGTSLLPRLEHLDLSGNPLTPIFDRAQFPNLRELMLAGTGVQELPDLYGILVLDLHDTPVRRIGANTLVELNLSNTPNLPTLSLAKSAALVNLSLDGATFASNSNLEYGPSVGRLSLRRGQNVDLTRLRAFPNLAVLILDDSDAVDLRPLEGLRYLWALSLRGTRVRELAPLRRAGGLLVLRVASGQFSKTETAHLASSVLIIPDDARRIPEMLPRSERLAYLGLAFILFIAPVILKTSIAQRRIHSAVPLQLAGFWRWWGLLALTMLVLSHVVPLNSYRSLAVNIFLSTAGYLVFYTVLLLVSRTPRAGRSTIPLWILRLRNVPRLSVVGLPVILFGYLMFRTAEASGNDFWRFEALVVFGSLFLVWKGLVKLLVALSPLGGLSGLVRDVFTNRGRRVRSTVPQEFVHHLSDGVEKPQLKRDPQRFPNYLHIAALQAALDKRAWESSGRDHRYSQAVVIGLSRGDLARAAEWELALIEGWIRTAWTNTIAPVWLIGDWVGVRDLDAISTPHAQNWVARVMPFLSGISSTAEPVAKAAALNVDTTVCWPDLLSVLGSSYTPVARLVRQVIAGAEVPERIDSLIRACETSIAFFAVAFAADYQSSVSPQLPRSTARLLRTATFSAWLAIIDSVGRQLASPAHILVERALSSPCSKEANKLRIQVRRLVGGATGSLGRPPVTIRDALQVVIEVRNWIAARGPLSQQGDRSLLRSLFIVVLKCLRVLPWDAVVLHSTVNGVSCEYRSCTPTPSPNSTEHDQTALLMSRGDGLALVRIDGSAYFLPLPRFGSVAMFANEDSLFDPISGVYLSSKRAAIVGSSDTSK